MFLSFFFSAYLLLIKEECSRSDRIGLSEIKNRSSKPARSSSGMQLIIEQNTQLSSVKN